MRRKNSGFTMIELLTAVVILGIMMGLAVPNVLKILNNSRNRTYVDDAVRLATTMDSRLRSDNMIMIPAINSCIMANLTYLDNNTFENAPYGGKYDEDKSFVVAKRQSDGYNFYVRLIEETKTGTYRGVDLAEVSKLEEKEGTMLVKNLPANKVFNMSDYANNTDGANSIISGYGIGCGDLIVYLPNAKPE